MLPQRIPQLRHPLQQLRGGLVAAKEDPLILFGKRF